MDYIAVSIAVILIVAGVAGTFFPVVPAIPAIFAVIAAYGWYEGFQNVTPYYLAVLGGVTVLSMLVDNVAAYFGAKFFDSSRQGMWGAVLGGVAGIFLFPPLGLIIGPWLGAIIGERLNGTDWHQSFRSGLGATIGLLSGIAFKIGLGMMMFISFLWVIL